MKLSQIEKKVINSVIVVNRKIYAEIKLKVEIIRIYRDNQDIYHGTSSRGILGNSNE